MSEDWKPAWVSEMDLETVIGLFLYDRGEMGGTDHELEEIYQWTEETRMNQYLLECVLDGLLVPAYKDDALAFKITEKGQKVAMDALKGEKGRSMDNPRDSFIATKVLEWETGLELKPIKKKGGDNGNGNGSK